MRRFYDAVKYGPAIEIQYNLGNRRIVESYFFEIPNDIEYNLDVIPISIEIKRLDKIIETFKINRVNKTGKEL